MNQNSLKKNILFTVAYYDAFGYPLTTFEIWRHLIDFEKSKQPASMKEIVEFLESEETGKILSCNKGFWTLKGRTYLAENRIEKYKVFLRKIQALRFWVKVISFLPYVRAIFVTGTLAMKNVKRKSDWDVLIIMAKNRIWLGRLIVTIFLHLVGKRRHGGQTKNRFCLNHFLTENGLILEERNEYTASEVIFSIPIYGRELYQKFQQLNNFWVKNYKPNYEWDKAVGDLMIEEGRIGKYSKKVAEGLLEYSGFGKFFNSICKKAMIYKIKKNPKTYLVGADIRYSDQALVFLPKPQRDVIFSKAKLIINE